MRKVIVVLLSIVLCLLFVVSAAPQMKYKEAPMLAELVKAGKLPPVEKRLPKEPTVIKPVEEIGQYGGTWRLATWDFAGLGNVKMILYDPPVRWNEDYTAYIPGFCTWEFDKTGKEITFHIKEGLKWSDGAEFTTDDIMFYWEDLAKNEDYGYLQIPWWAYKDGKPMEVKKIDKYTFKFISYRPNWIIHEQWASGFWEWEPWMKPKHYLSQFHPKYNKAMKDYETLRLKSDWWKNPDHPTLFAWVMEKYDPATARATLVRNPYYWKVDTAGNQLPYIDRMEVEGMVQREVETFKIVRGEYDAQFRAFQGAFLPSEIQLILNEQKRGDYRVIMWKNGAGAWPGMMVNQWYNGEGAPEDVKAIRELLRNKKFRQALSVAINRDRVNQIGWFGLSVPQQGTISPQAWHFKSPEGQKVFKEWASSYAQYDPALANRWLDEIGMDKRDAEGFRLRPDGKKFELIIDVTAWGTEELNSKAAALVKEDFQKVGIRTTLNVTAGQPVEAVRQSQGLYMLRFAHASEMDIWTYPDWIFPTRDNRMWPLNGRWKQTGGKEGVAPLPGDPADRLLKIWERGLEIPTDEERHKLVYEAIRIHIEEGPFIIGICGDAPHPIVVKNYFRNVPDFGILGPWAPGGPGNTNPPQYFIKK
ncbi:MAG: ABC transporter substrate-binding protein [bacterium]